MLELRNLNAVQTRITNPAVQELIDSGRRLLFHEARPSAAIECFERALAIEPSYAPAHFMEGVARLTVGQYQTGFRKHDYRYYVFDDLRRLLLPGCHFWGGEDIAGRTIVLLQEQGFGDTIQFVRYLPMVAARGAKVTLAVPESLCTLMRASMGRFASVPRLPGNTITIKRQIYCPLGSLPVSFQTTLATVPNTMPYLSAPAAYRKRWARCIKKKGARPAVGLAWAGSPRHINDGNRSLLLASLLPAVEDRECNFYSLQRDLRDGDGDLLAQHNIQHVGESLTDFADTAAVIEQLDLVISVDTSVAHLAGALGKRVWILLPVCADWRWLTSREDSPWYPTARLFRQSKPGDWSAVIARLHTELKHSL
jgi:hypothetical protein